MTVAQILLAGLVLLLSESVSFANFSGPVVSVLACGKRAKQAASELVFGKEVSLQTYGKDKYGRTIADVLAAYSDLDQPRKRLAFLLDTGRLDSLEEWGGMKLLISPQRNAAKPSS